MKKLVYQIKSSKDSYFQVCMQYGIGIDAEYINYQKCSKIEAIKHVKAFYNELNRQLVNLDNMLESYLTIYTYVGGKYSSDAYIFAEKHFNELQSK